MHYIVLNVLFLYPTGFCTTVLDCIAIVKCCTRVRPCVCVCVCVCEWWGPGGGAQEGLKGKK